jgi:uncharacterized membrane protein YgdD (TMEM256/DUF423 family)
MLMAGSFFGALAVALGAFGAHSLKKIVPPETVATFQTGVQYQMYHAIVLLVIGFLAQKADASLLKWAGICMIAGILLFSGSLYILTLLKAKNAVGLSGIGIITPFGGLFFIAGWLLLFFAVYKSMR